MSNEYDQRRLIRAMYKSGVPRWVIVDKFNMSSREVDKIVETPQHADGMVFDKPIIGQRR